MIEVTDFSLFRNVVHAGRTEQALQAIGQPGVEMAVWQRTALTKHDWIAQLSPHALPACRLMLQPHEVRTALNAVCEAGGTSRDAARDAFVEDVTALAALFGSLARCDAVRLRLDVIRDDSCSRWHRDCVPLRLICTYRGPATQWVAPELANAVMSAPDDDTPHAGSLALGDVALFKGCGWPGLSHEGGIVHRSPRINGTGQVRLVLVIDAPMRHAVGVGQKAAPTSD